MEKVSEETIVEAKNEECQQQIQATPKRINGKKLRKIRHQMEFYFSDANLKRDRMLNRMIQESADGFVDLEIFLTFNKIRSMTENIEDLVKAVSQSNHLEIDENKTKVCRKFPLARQTRNTEALTIYAEKIPPHADHKFVKNIFQRFGKVVYVSLPFFRNSDKNKGYAFVEFESEDAVKLAYEGFKEQEEENSTQPVASDDQCEEIKEKSNVVVKPEGNKSYRRKRKKSESTGQPPERVVKVESTSESSCKKEKNNLNIVVKTEMNKSHRRKRKKSESTGQPPEKVVKVESTSESTSENLSTLQNHDHCTSKHSRKRRRQNSECETPPKKNKAVSNEKDSSRLPKSDSTDEQGAKEVMPPASSSPPLEKNVKNSSALCDKLSKNTEGTDVDDGSAVCDKSLEITEGTDMDGATNVDDGSAVCDKSLEITEDTDMDGATNVDDGSAVCDKSLQITEGIEKDEAAILNTDEVMNESELSASKKRKKTHGRRLKLRVMTMEEWKMERNRYLSMQRKAMSAIKKMLLIDQQQTNKCESVLYHPSTARERHRAQYSVQGPGEKNSDIKLQEGVILKILMSENSENPDPKELREKVKLAASDVAYVDTTTLDDSKMYVRFHSPESAGAAVTSESLNKMGTCEIISGEEETLYWEKLKLDRTAQRNRQRPKIRGRDKILAKSAKLEKNHHIFFKE